MTFPLHQGVVIMSSHQHNHQHTLHTPRNHQHTSLRPVLLKLADVADRQFFLNVPGTGKRSKPRSLNIVSLFSGKYPRTGRRWYVYRHRYAYHTLSITALDHILNICALIFSSCAIFSLSQPHHVMVSHSSPGDNHQRTGGRSGKT